MPSVDWLNRKVCERLPTSYVSIKACEFNRSCCRSYGGLLALLVGFLIGGAAKAADVKSPQSVSDSVARLETDSGLAVDHHLPLAQRLSVVELKLLGKPMSGPLLPRVQALRTALDARKQLPAKNHFSDTMPLMNAIPPNFLRIEPPGTKPVAADYFNDVMKGNGGKILRFKSMPVPVFINQFPDRQFVASVVKGFETWEERTHGEVRFVQVDEAAKARIIVIWKRLGGEQDASGCGLGAHTITKYTTKGKGSVSVVDVGGVPLPIYIPKMGPKYTVPPQAIEVNLDMIMNKSPLTRYRLLQNVVTHELGHALGLLGHSQNTFDLMYSVTDEHSRLSERDINTLIRLYKQKTDVPL